MLAQALPMTEIDLPYIKRYRDRHGKLRLYVRRKGRPAAALPGKPGSDEFMSAYSGALEGQQQAGGKHGHGTLGGLIAEFYKSVWFANLKASSQTTYRIVLGKVAEEHGHRIVRQAKQEKLEKIIQSIGETRPGMANLTRSLLHRVFSLAVKLKWRTDNPMVGIEAYKIGTRHTWTNDEMGAYEARWALGTRERLAYELLLNTDQRGGDVVKMMRTEMNNGSIVVSQQKVRKGKVKIVTVWITPRLQRALKAGPHSITYLIANADGTPMTRPALTRLVRAAATAAGLPDICKPHGLRKSQQRRLAELGATGKELQAVAGHSSSKETDLYTAAVDQARLARSAMERLGDE